MTIQRLIPLLSIALLAANARSQSILRSVTGGAGQQFGASIARYVDLDGDGLPELLVGAPGTNNDAGSVSVVSSKFIATGVGAPVLWTVPSPSSKLFFGMSVVSVGDVNGDGVADFAVGGEGDSALGVAPSIAIVSGASHAIIGGSGVLSGITARFGAAIALGGDYDGDGFADLVVGMPNYSDVLGTTGSGFMVMSPRKMVVGGSWLLTIAVNAPEFDQEGFSISSADFDGDGKLDIVVGAPYAVSASSVNGAVRVYRGSNYSLYQSIAGTGGEHLGWSVDASRDVNGDGVRDILVGGPLAPGGGSERGEAIVLSGAKLAAGIPPFDVLHWKGATDFEHFGFSVAATPDVNGDFLGDAVVGSPDYSTIFALNSGAVTFFSGATGESMGVLYGLPGDHLGESLAAAWAYDGTIHFDIAAGSPESNAGGANAGVVRIAKLYPTIPSIYCTSKVNSLGCTPAISYSGSPSATSASSFAINATNVLNNKNGLLFYGYLASSLPFQGGTLCVKAPVKRTSVQSTHGNPPPNDCSGSMSFNFNAYIQSGADPALYVGRQVFTQYWSRDPNSPSTTSLTNALRFLINP